jgi:hypothetical protein
MTQQSKNKMAVLFIVMGLGCSIILSLLLPEDKLILALSGPTALIGAGLSQWTSHNDN